LKHQSLLLDIIGRMKGRAKGERRRMQMLQSYRCWQKMVMWHWSEKLKTDGDGVIERHVKNLLFSRILDEKELVTT